MGLFSGDKNANFLGVDIGGSSIKLVELTNNNGRAQLVTYGYLERALSGTKLIDEPDKTAELIKRVVEQSKATSRRAITALPSSVVFTAIISLPEILKKDLSSTKKLTEAVEWEAKKVLPMPLEEMVLDWKLLTKPEDLVKKEEQTEKIHNVQVLLTAAAKEVVTKYIQVFKKAGLELISLETESFALARSMVGKDKSLVVLVDIGAVNTDISIIENTIPIVNRSVGIGGMQISQAIAQTLNIKVEQAEQFKRDLEGNVQDLGAGETLPEVIKRPIQTIVDEIQYSINFYLEQAENANKRVEKVILSGGTANLFNLPKYFSDTLNLKTFIGNPWARVIYPEDLDPILQSIGPRLATALGLAMRDIE
ncbi:MAG: Type IV pilus assembly protein PilM [Parcubacteria group bacterium GW2011_GWC2_39_14]|nr:MAG: Type IV pilus assembly protein PilM [Parcubacteria group bacterium GW2011_GWC2_39_14]KKR53577.1 MAG: Type IV pilus assembly protein PilM [Parcubacteria group bacterium GW2011_GWA2_40_23]